MLIKHVLSSIPLHVFASLQSPKTVLRQLEQLFSSFFCGVPLMECQKRFGALGVGFACLYRKRVLVFVALLTIYIFYSCKLWWKVHTGDGLWSRYVNSITVSRSFAASRLADVDDLMRQHTTYLVRSGSFLHSNWSGLGFLRDLFP